MWYGLCDCNSFYASCERLFRPDLLGKPVAVLSNNDGCIVALTREAKQAGLKRGDALFKVKDVVDRGGVTVFSSNYPLYQSISDCVMAALKELVGSVQQYSIDESFFTVEEADQAWCDQLRKTMVQWTGMPVAIAVARTKTLAKAGEEACKHTTGALFVPPEMEAELLKKTAISDVWGIGWRSGPALVKSGVATAWDLVQKDELWIRRRLSITGLKTVMELRGMDVISLEEPQRQSICSGISFGKPIDTLAGLRQAAARHCMSLAEKLHQHHLMTTEITVSAFTDRFREDFICPIGTMRLRQATSYAPDLIKASAAILREIYRPGRYKGCRVWANGLVRPSDRQLELDETDQDIQRHEKRDRMQETVEEIHARYGRMSLVPGATGLQSKAALMQQGRLSPRYTTDITQLPVANANRIAKLFSSDG
ncbi:MAG: Y-family DNA polymerase [Sphaerochaeta sp.]|jgi:DNA polymerase V|nr:Y-family DNA polymerase [Sphaerochaeta sp.]